MAADSSFCRVESGLMHSVSVGIPTGRVSAELSVWHSCSPVSGGGACIVSWIAASHAASSSAGAAVPADCRVLEGEKPVQVDQAALTGERLPVTAMPGDEAKMGSNVTSGESLAVVIATGAETFFGRTAAMIESVDEMGHFQKVILWAAATFFALSASPAASNALAARDFVSSSTRVSAAARASSTALSTGASSCSTSP